MSRSASATSSAASSVQPPAKTESARKTRCSSSDEEVVAPGDGRPECLLAGVGVSAAFQQIEAIGEAIENLHRSKRLRAGGSELDCEREVVEASAELGDLVREFEPGALAEEIDCLGRGEWRHRVLDLALYAQELAACAEKGEVGAGLHEP